MLNFCPKCGSLMADEVCTNKKCITNKTVTPSLTRTRQKNAIKGKVVKPARKVLSDHEKARRNSKVITYSISELEKRENK